jgi:hypothetical protein
MSNQKRIGLEGTIKAYAGCSRIIATIQRASSTELPAESGEKRRRAVPVNVRPFCASKQQKNVSVIPSHIARAAVTRHGPDSFMGICLTIWMTIRLTLTLGTSAALK